MYKIFENFEEFKEVEPKIYAQLDNDYGLDINREDQVFVYNSYGDYAYYSVTESYLFGTNIEDLKAGPILLENYIDFDRLGKDMMNTFDDYDTVPAGDGKVVYIPEGISN